MPSTARQPIRKAVFPVAGLGTRFLPATKAMPKELLPIIDKPIIQYAVEEAVGAGITDLIFVTGRTKRAIEDNFDENPGLERALRDKGENENLTGTKAKWFRKSINVTMSKRVCGRCHTDWPVIELSNVPNRLLKKSALGLVCGT